MLQLVQFFAMLACVRASWPYTKYAGRLASAVTRTNESAVRTTRQYASYPYREEPKLVRRVWSGDDPGTGDSNRKPPKEIISEELSLEYEAAARQARLRYGYILPPRLLSKGEYEAYERIWGEPLLIPTEDELALFESRRGCPESIHYEGTEDGVPSEIWTQEAEDMLDAAMSEDEDKVDAVWGISEEGEVDDRWLDRKRAEDEYQLMEEAQQGSSPRAYPLTIAGRFGDSRAVVAIPEDTIVEPTSRILNPLPMKHVRQTVYYHFGKQLEHSVATPIHDANRHLQQRPPPLTASQTSMTATEAAAFIACNTPGIYASAMTALVEVRKRLGHPWLEQLLQRPDGPRMLDAGGAGAGVQAWREILRAEWARMHPGEDPTPECPLGQSTIVVGSTELSSRISVLSADTTILPRLPDFDRVRDLPGSKFFVPKARKHYDLIVASHSMWTFAEEWERKAHVQNLWSLLNPRGGVLLFVEKGVPRGFELIGGARQLLLDHHIASPSSNSAGEAKQPTAEKGMIIAPCTNHGECPMYRIPGEMAGRKDFCRFTASFTRPQYLKRLLGEMARADERIRFSFVAVQRGKDLREKHSIPQDESATQNAFKGFEEADPLSSDSDFSKGPHPLSLPRLILPPLKQQGHVILDVCTPSATIERWTLPKSHSKQGYRDARKARWGDLWPLGAKTRVLREAKSGVPKQSKSFKSRIMGETEGEDAGKQKGKDTRKKKGGQGREQRVSRKKSGRR